MLALEYFDSLGHVILGRAESERDPSIVETRSPRKDRPNDGEESLGIRPVHVERAVAEVDGDLITIELAHAGGVDGGLELLLDFIEGVETACRVVEVDDDSCWSNCASRQLTT